MSTPQSTKPKLPKLRRYGGGIFAFKAHDRGCAHSRRTDRAAGLIYPLFKLASGKLVSWDEASRDVGFCAYCGTR